MAFENVKLLVGEYVAASDLSADQYKFVMFDAGTDVVLADAANILTLGVLQDQPASGEVCTIGNGGVSKVVTAGALARGAFVTPDASGLAVAAAADEPYYGMALTASAGAGEVIEIDMDKNGYRSV